MVVSMKEKLYLAGVYLLLALAALIVILPLLYVVSVSLTPYAEVLKNGGFTLIPRNITFEAYTAFLQDYRIPTAYRVTLFITIVGTTLNLLFTSMMAYPLSNRQLPYRKVLMILIVFTLLFNGGIIPTYLIVKETGLINSLWAMIIPGTISTFYLLIMKTFYEDLPEGLQEAAKIDGAGELRTFMSIVLPLSLPVMTTLGLFYSVGHWNQFFAGIIYMTDQAKYPLQVVLRGILTQSQMDTIDFETVLPTESLQMAAVILSTLPILVVYPFVQRFFTQGALLGSVKG